MKMLRSLHSILKIELSIEDRFLYSLDLLLSLGVQRVYGSTRMDWLITHLL